MLSRNRPKLTVLYAIASLNHFSYHEPVIDHLCARGHKVIALLGSRSGEDHLKGPARACEARNPALTLGRLAPCLGPWQKPRSVLRSLRSYASYLNRTDQSDFYRLRQMGYLPGSLRSLVRYKAPRYLLKSRRGQNILRSLEGWVPLCRPVLRSLQQYRPDIVIASPANMRFYEEVEYLKAARALRVPTIVPVLSWDNLTTKGTFPTLPDLLLAWNQAHFEQAVSLHGFPHVRICITGAPFLDKWFTKPRTELSRSDFCSRIGIDASQPFLLYLGSSANIARDETWLVAKLAGELLASSDDRLRNLVIVVRPHGANQEIFKKLSAPNVNVWIRETPLPDNPLALSYFRAALDFSVCAVGLNTTAMLDAVILDRPVLALLVEEYRDRNTAQAVHFRLILDADVYERPETITECLSAVQQLLDGKDGKGENRHRFVDRFVRPRGPGRAAGEISAQVIELAAHRGMSVADIEEELALA